MIRLKFLLKQFPFIFPKCIIQSASAFIDKRNRKADWYKSMRSYWHLRIETGEFYFNEPPNTLNESFNNFFAVNRSYKSYDCSLFYLSDAFVYGNEGFILTNFHSLFQEFTHTFNIENLRSHVYKKPFKFFTFSYIRKDASAAILLSPQSHNFYHWTSDVLTRIRLYEPVLKQIDYFCIADDVPESFLAVLPYFGVKKERILKIKKNEKLQFKHLYVSSLPGSEGRSGLWSITYLREKLLNANPGEAKVKYYLKRGNASQRNIINEDEVINTLAQNGFEILDTGSISFEEQIDKMKMASMVIGMHGAALTNILYTPPKCKVIEIHTTDYFRTDCYYTLAAMRNLPYWYIKGESAGNGKWGDITLSIIELMKTIHAGIKE